MILGFNPRFPSLILAHVKIHTIRSDQHNRWKAGRIIQFATGVRTKNYNQFMVGECVSTQNIKIDWNDMPDIEISIDGKKMFDHWGLAKNDGFDSLKEFYEWFDKDFIGKIIHFTSFRY